MIVRCSGARFGLFSQTSVLNLRSLPPPPHDYSHCTCKLVMLGDMNVGK
eukprot:SAG31_NODE_47176_length_251_cov_0.993421_1_plen_48_part_10